MSRRRWAIGMRHRVMSLVCSGSRAPEMAQTPLGNSQVSLQAVTTWLTGLRTFNRFPNPTTERECEENII